MYPFKWEHTVAVINLTYEFFCLPGYYAAQGDSRVKLSGLTLEDGTDR
jgi:hypothetical protein